MVASHPSTVSAKAVTSSPQSKALPRGSSFEGPPGFGLRRRILRSRRFRLPARNKAHQPESHPHQPRGLHPLLGLPIGLLLLALGFGQIDRGQGAPARSPSTSAGGKVEHFFRAVVEYFPQGSAKTVLEGKSAQPQPNGELLIEQLRLTTFETPGKTNFIVEAPLCFYDSNKKLAYSSGQLLCYTADRKLSIGGEGFLWKEAIGRLFISNQVRTVIQHDLMTSQFKR